MNFHDLSGFGVLKFFTCRLPLSVMIMLVTSVAPTFKQNRNYQNASPDQKWLVAAFILNQKYKASDGERQAQNE
ncbi:MAG: hypothetical protein CXR31_00645 [Geobacter sp.]|nr:MAG: hypothetical protein CXR31_00645 [Geobacter sp.]